MYRKSLPGDRQGVAGAVATMFILLIVLMFITIYISGFVPVYARSQEYNHMQQLNEQFSAYQLQNYNLESGNWPYPVTTTMNLGTAGIAPFSSPTTGSLTYSSSSFIATLTYQLGLPLSLPSCQHDFYENLTGTTSGSGPGGGAIGIHATFYTDTNNSYYVSASGSGPGGNTNPVYYAAEGSTVCYKINSSYVTSDDFDVFLGGNGGPAISNLTLIVYLYGSHNIIDFTGDGNNITIWYISYGSDNQVFDQQNPCGFGFTGHNDKGYIQDYGSGDTAPFGWPQFLTIPQYSTVIGSLSASVYNQYYTPQTLVYQGGAVILSQHRASIVQSGPQLSALNSSSTGATVALNLISLLGQNFTLSGNGPVSLTNTYFSGSNLSVGQYKGINRINVLNLSIQTSYASAWAKYFTTALSKLQNVTSNPLVAFVGNGCYDVTGTHVTWGAYSISVTGDTLNLSIYNIANLDIGIGYLQTTAN